MRIPVRKSPMPIKPLRLLPTVRFGTVGMPTGHLSAGFPVAVAGVLFLVLTALFSRWNASSAWAFPQFAAVTLAVLYFPGRLLTS